MNFRSKNWYKQKLIVNKLHEKITNQRKDFLHKLNRQIANDYDIVCVENLDMKAMSQCLNFGKSVMDNGWGLFTSYLSYKVKKLVKIDKWFPSSKTCHVCGYKNENLTLNDRNWTCPKCDTQLDRDINAAINIKNQGLLLV
jgi:putative transposase